MSFESLVLGGVTSPVFFKMDDNYVTNPYADQNTTGWVASGGSLVREVHSNAYGEYMFDFSYTTDFEYAYWQEDLGAAATNKKFLASFRAVADSPQDILVQITDSTGVVIKSTVFTIGETSKKYVLYGDVIGTTLNQFIQLRIYATDVSGTGQVNFDHVFFSEVLDTISMPSTKIQNGDPDLLKFKKIIRGKNELWDGNIQEFGKIWRPNYVGTWHHMNPTTELSRQRVAQAGRVFVLPHSDIDWGFLGIWDGDFVRRYSFNRYIGHTGNIPIKGIEYIHELPLEITGGLAGVIIEV